jgi:hypothetical protein
MLISPLRSECEFTRAGLIGGQRSACPFSCVSTLLFLIIIPDYYYYYGIYVYEIKIAVGT